jgi:hypothetical protein
MKMERACLSLLSIVGLFACIAGEQALAQSQPAAKQLAVPSMTFDCTNVTVDYSNDPSLTREEKLQLMDQALFKSLSKFDACQRSQSNAGGGAANNSGGGIGASGSGQTGSSAASGGESVATSDMTGQEAPKTEKGESGQSSNVAWSDLKGKKENEDVSASAIADSQPASAANGKLPEDIPPANNDSVLEAQIRQAAINETDPDTKAKLWNEYRKYKGLPAKN